MEMTTEERSTVAHTIVNQLTHSENGYRRLQVMTGANNFVVMTEECGGIRFRFPSSPKADAVRIVLTHADLYDMTFIKESKVVETYEGVFNDQLKELFERFTGLYLSL